MEKILCLVPIILGVYILYVFTQRMTSSNNEEGSPTSEQAMRQGASGFLGSGFGSGLFGGSLRHGEDAGSQGNREQHGGYSSGRGESDAADSG